MSVPSASTTRKPDCSPKFDFALIFVLSIAVSLFGFTDITAGTARIAEILFYVSLALLVVVLILELRVGWAVI